MGIHTEWTKRNCPVCGSDRPSEKAVVASKMPAEMLSFIEVQSFFVGIRTDQVFFSYFRCTNCSLLYCPYYFSESQLAIVYSNMPDNLLGEKEEIAGKTQEGYARTISRNTRSAKTYLELGPDTGLLMSQIGFSLNVECAYLIEPNMRMHQILGKRSGDFRRSLIVRDLNDLPADVTEVDLFVGVHVFDHLLEPLSTLYLLRQRSSSDSVLAMVVHNERSLLRYFLQTKWPPFCLQHPQLFNTNTARDMFSRAGWQMTVSEKTTNYFSIGNLMRLLNILFGIKEKTNDKFLRLQMPIKLGNRIYIARSK